MKKIFTIILFLITVNVVSAQNAAATKQSSPAKPQQAKSVSKSKETQTRYVDKKQNHFQQHQNNNSKSSLHQVPTEKKVANSK